MIVGKPSQWTSSARSSHRWKGQRHTRRMRVKRRPIPNEILPRRRRGTNPSEGYSTGFGLTCMRGVTWDLRGYIRARAGVDFVSGKLFCDSKITGKNAVRSKDPGHRNGSWARVVTFTSRLPPASNQAARQRAPRLPFFSSDAASAVEA
jgi:hypothetical protein